MPMLAMALVKLSYWCVSAIWQRSSIGIGFTGSGGGSAFLYDHCNLLVLLCRHPEGVRHGSS